MHFDINMVAEMKAVATLARHLSSVDQVGNISADRAEMLHATTTAIVGPDRRAAAFLWLADQWKSEFTFTIWAHETHPAPNRIKETDLFRVNMTVSTDTRDPNLIVDDVTDLLKQLANPSGKQENYISIKYSSLQFEINRSRIINTLMKNKISPDHQHFLILKHHNSEGPSLIGVAQIILEGAPIEINDDRSSILANMIGTRISLGRRQRVDDAIKEFQTRAWKAKTERDLYKAATDVIGKFLHKGRCRIYRTGRHGDLVQVVDDSNGDPVHVPATGLVGHVHLHPIGREETYTVRLRNVADETERERKIGRAIALEPTDTGDCGADEPVAAMLTQAAASVDARVPLATIHLLARPTSGFSGGLFSQTDEEICKRIASYLAQLAPGVIVRERTNRIVQYLQSSDPGGLDVEAESDALFAPFAALVRDLIPAVTKVWVIARHDEKAVRWISPDGQVSYDLYPVDLERTVAGNPITLDADGDLLYLEMVLHAKAVTFAVAWFCPNVTLADHDLLTIRLIASEVRLRALGRIDVDDLISQIAELRHAVRSPFAGITGHVHTLLDEIDLAKDMSPEDVYKTFFQTASINKALRSIAYSTDQAGRFLESIRISHIHMTRDELRINPTDVAEIVKQIYRALRPIFDQRKLEWRFDNDISRNDPVPHVDKDTIYLALANLVDNAAKYARRGTEISAALGIQSNRWYFTITDIGRYIPVDDRERIFLPRVRLSTERGEQQMPGTGLGLPAVKHIVALHDPQGKVGVSSRLLPRTAAGDAQTAETTFTISMRINTKIGN